MQCTWLYSGLLEDAQEHHNQKNTHHLKTREKEENWLQHTQSHTHTHTNTCAQRHTEYILHVWLYSAVWLIMWFSDPSWVSVLGSTAAVAPCLLNHNTPCSHWGPPICAWRSVCISKGGSCVYYCVLWKYDYTLCSLNIGKNCNFF